MMMLLDNISVIKAFSLADALVAVCCKVLSKGVAVREDEVVIDVGDDDEDCRVVRAIGIDSISVGERRQVLREIAEVDIGSSFAGFGVVDILDVYTAVGD